MGAARPPLVPRIKTRGDDAEKAAEAESAVEEEDDEEEDSTTEYSVTSKKAAAAEHSESPPAAERRKRGDAATEEEPAPPPEPLRAGGPERGLVKREGTPPSGPAAAGLAALVANAGGRGEGTRPGPPRRGRWTTKFCFCFFRGKKKASWFFGGRGFGGRKFFDSAFCFIPSRASLPASSSWALPVFFFDGRETLDVASPQKFENGAKREKRASTKAARCLAVDASLGQERPRARCASSPSEFSPLLTCPTRMSYARALRSSHRP